MERLLYYLETLLLTHSEVERLLNPLDLYSQLVEAFKAYSLERNSAALRVRSSLKLNNTSAMILFPGQISHVPAYTIKNHSKFPLATPAIKGVINLFDLDTGELLSIMDSTHVTAVRTGLSGAIGTHLLARKDSKKVAVIGAGVQGKIQLLSLNYVRDFTDVFVYDLVNDKAIELVNQMQNKIQAHFQLCKTLEQAVCDADIIITATWSREPFLFSSMIKKGVHITAVGPDEPCKAELSAELIKKALFICDDRELAVTMGALGGVGLTSEYVHAEIGEVINNQNLGRTSEEQITVYGFVGLAFQDLAGAWQVYRKAKELNVGQKIDFLK